MKQPLYITWLNYLGGFEYFYFKAENVYNIDVLETGVTRRNLLPDWPKSYGATADTIEKQTYRKAKKQVVLRSQHLTRNQLDALTYIATSPLVQIVQSRTNKRTVLVSPDSFQQYDEAQDLFTLQFTLSYTDDIPSQRL